MVNKRTERGETALLVAVSREHLRCVQVLLDHGADPDISNHERETPLYKGNFIKVTMRVLPQHLNLEYLLIPNCYYVLSL